MNKTNFPPHNERIASSCVCCGSRALKKSPAVLMPFVAHRAFGWEPVEITDDWGLKTIKNGMAYSICNSVQCGNCGHLFLDIRFNESEMKSLYDAYREKEYTELREKYEPGYQERNDRLNSGINYIPDIEQFLSPHLKFPISILDWGGDTGRNTPFKTSNKLLHIYDISNKPVVINGAVKISKVTASTRYDLIICSNVCEHIPYPIDIISDIKKSMGIDTVLYIEVPLEDIVRTNDAKTALHQQKKHWHEHINFFTDKSIKALLAQCGLSIIDLKVLEATAGGNSSYLYQVACKLH